MALILNPEGLKILQYPFPVKGKMGTIFINRQETEAAHTSGRGKSYTYFKFDGTDYYVSGIVPFGTEHTIEFPDDYKPKELRVVRKKVNKGPKVKPQQDQESGDHHFTPPPPFSNKKKKSK